MNNRTRTGLAGVALLLLGACGSSSSPASTAEDFVGDMTNGRYGDMWEHFAPELRNQITKADYVKCAIRNAGASSAGDVKVKARESLDSSYMSSSGTTPTKSVRVEVSNARESASLTVELERVGDDWRVVDMVMPAEFDDPDETPCVKVAA